jgi:MerR family transcriptional regulator/heat shock protein HspR
MASPSESETAGERDGAGSPSPPRPLKNRDEPIYTISIAARLVRPVRTLSSVERPLHAQTLRAYEREGLVKPKRVGRNRLYSDRDIERLQQIQQLTHERGVNLAGVEIILDLMERIRALEEALGNTP